MKISNIKTKQKSMVLCTDDSVFEYFKNILNIKLVDSKGWRDANGEIPYDRREFEWYIQLYKRLPKKINLNYNRKTIKKNIVTPKDTHHLISETNYIDLLLYFYETSKKINFNSKDPNDLGYHNFEIEYYGEFQNRCYDYFNRETYYILSPRVNDYSNSIKYTGAIFSEIREIAELMKNQLGINNIIINTPDSLLEDIVSQNESMWDDQNELEGKMLDNMFDEANDELARWDDEDSTWRIANDFD